MAAEARVRTALVTGVSRPRGIGSAICRVLVRDGWRVVASGWPGYDREVSWADPDLDHVDRLVADLKPSERFQWHEVDLGNPDGAVALFDFADKIPGGVDALVAAHARSLPGGVLEVRRRA